MLIFSSLPTMSSCARAATDPRPTTSTEAATARPAKRSPGMSPSDCLVAPVQRLVAMLTPDRRAGKRPPDESEAVAVACRSDIRLGVRGQQQARGDERGGGGLDPGGIGLPALVALGDRGARIAGGLALGAGSSEGDQRAVAIGQFVR